MWRRVYPTLLSVIKKSGEWSNRPLPCVRPLAWSICLLQSLYCAFFARGNSVQGFTRREDQITKRVKITYRSFSRICTICTSFRKADPQDLHDLCMRGKNSRRVRARVCKHIVLRSGTICVICTRFHVMTRSILMTRKYVPIHWSVWSVRSSSGRSWSVRSTYSSDQCHGRAAAYYFLWAPRMLSSISHPNHDFDNFVRSARPTFLCAATCDIIVLKPINTPEHIITGDHSKIGDRIWLVKIE